MEGKRRSKNGVEATFLCHINLQIFFSFTAVECFGMLQQNHKQNSKSVMKNEINIL